MYSMVKSCKRVIVSLSGPSYVLAAGVRRLVIRIDVCGIPLHTLHWRHIDLVDLVGTYPKVNKPPIAAMVSIAIQK